MQRLPLFEDLEFLVPPSRGIWFWVIAGAAVLVGGIAIWILGKQKKNKHLAGEKYLEQLTQLHSKVGKIDQYSFMTEVSKVIRRYIEERFGIEATKQTTREFLGTIFKDGRILEPHRTLLGDFLQEADLVKFARKQYDLDQLEKLHAAAVKFVTETQS